MQTHEESWVLSRAAERDSRRKLACEKSRLDFPTPSAFCCPPLFFQQTHGESWFFFSGGGGIRVKNIRDQEKAVSKLLIESYKHFWVSTAR